MSLVFIFHIYHVLINFREGVYKAATFSVIGDKLLNLIPYSPYSCSILHNCKVYTNMAARLSSDGATNHCASQQLSDKFRILPPFILLPSFSYNQWKPCTADCTGNPTNQNAVRLLYNPDSHTPAIQTAAQYTTKCKINDIMAIIR